MARSKNNIATQGLSGLVGQFVYRQCFGQTIVSKKPRAAGAPSALQLSTRALFKQAAAYAKAALTDLTLQQLYKAKAKRGQTAYNVAIADFYQAPEIGEVDVSAYSGSAGSPISVAVTDDVQVDSVRMKIEAVDGSLVEEGAARPHPDGLHWVYTATVQTGERNGATLTVTASDLPHHHSIKLVKL